MIFRSLTFGRMEWFTKRYSYKFDVSRYFPAGNQLDQFHKNVKPAKIIEMKPEPNFQKFSFENMIMARALHTPQSSDRQRMKNSDENECPCGWKRVSITIKFTCIFESCENCPNCRRPVQTALDGKILV